MSRPSTSILSHIRSNVGKRFDSNPKLFQNQSEGGRIYPDFESAVRQRILSAKSAPGDQNISYEAARDLVERATVPVDDSGGGVRFAHDPRLQWPSLLYFDESQVLEILKNVDCPTLIIKAKNGWPHPDVEQRERRLASLKNLMLVEVSGSHHCHADPDTVDMVASAIKDFYEKKAK